MTTEYSIFSTDVDNGDGTRTCRIGNCLNYYTEDNGWQPSNPDLVEASQPADWEDDDFPFAYANQTSPLQAYLVDDSDPDSSAHICLRLSSNPTYRIRIKAHASESKAHEDDKPNKKIKWNGLWKRTNFQWKIKAGALEKTLELTRSGHPKKFRFNIKYPEDHTYTVENNILTFYGPDGLPWLETVPPWGVDANGVVIPVTLTEGPQPDSLKLKKGKSLSNKMSVLITPDETALDSATYPVTIDPTLTLSGSIAIDDTVLSSANPNNNYGTYIRYHFQNTYNTLVKLNALPVIQGTITGFREKMYISAAPSPTSIRAYKIKSVNTWVEGTGSGSPVSGASCWNYCKYTTQAWAGAAGCSLDGTDYDSNPSPPTVPITTTGWITLELPPAWVGVNMGFIILCSDSYAVAAYSSDSGTTPAYFEIDYVASRLPKFFYSRRQ
jgi:hypothetical protein